MRYILEERFILCEDDDPRDPISVKSFDFSKAADTWETKYEACESQEDYQAFWMSYLKEIFKESAPKAKGLIPALAKYLPKCEDGWEPEDNPIVYLLGNLGKGNMNKVDLGAINAGNLSTMVKAYEDDYLTLDIIKDSCKASTVVCLNTPEFYSMVATEQLGYLKLQKAIAQKATTSWTKKFAELCTAGGKLLPLKTSTKNANKALKLSTNQESEVSNKKLGSRLQNLNKNEAITAFAVAYDAFRPMFPESLQAVANVFGGLKVLEELRNKVQVSGEQAQTWQDKFLPKGTKHTKESAATLLNQLLILCGLQPKTQEGTENVL